MFNRRSPSQAEVISAAVSDARAQDELRALSSDAALFICEVVGKAQAFNEELPRGYHVTPEGTTLVLKRNVFKALRPSKYWPFGSILAVPLRMMEAQLLNNPTSPIGLVATVENAHVRFTDANAFVADVNNGLIPEIGRYLIQRAKRNRGRVQAMRGAVDDVKTYRALLNDETW